MNGERSTLFTSWQRERVVERLGAAQSSTVIAPDLGTEHCTNKRSQIVMRLVNFFSVLGLPTSQVHTNCELHVAHHRAQRSVEHARWILAAPDDV